jgi:uncharacterized protein
MRYVGIALVRIYQLVLSPLTPNTCKYHPSCSQYAIDALREYGLLRGSILASWRLLRCNPWSRGGVDYAKDQRLFKRQQNGVPAGPPAQASHPTAALAQTESRPR